jgi:O-antigen ligase
MYAEPGKLRHPLEFGLLIAICIFLPLIEAPKNLAWVAYCVTWLVNRVRERDFGGRWDVWDSLIAAWIASGFLVAAFSGLQQSEWKGAGDLFRYGSLLWLVKRGGYSLRELRWAMGALVASMLAGLAFGYYQLLVSGKRRALELHSVGHVNHTAIYLAIMFGVCAAWIFARWNAWHAGRRITALAIGVLVLVSLIVTQSRGAAGAGLIAVPILAACWWPRWRTPLVASLVAIALAAALSVALGVEIVRKQQDRAQEQNVLAYRDGIWRSALVAWERFPWFGVGMDNYSGITPERVKAWREAAGKPYEAARYVRFPHGHSLYFNTLAERGTLGAAALAAALLAWLVSLVRRRPRPAAPDHEWLLWGGAAAAGLVTVGAGFVNTSLHHEHGILATLLLGLWLSRRRAS